MNQHNCHSCGKPLPLKEASFTVTRWCPGDKFGGGHVEFLSVYCPLCAIRKGMHPQGTAIHPSKPAFFVLLEHESTGESILVEHLGEQVVQAQRWAEDCDRGDWQLLGITGRRPLVMSLQSFELLAVAQDGTWYRKTDNPPGADSNG